MTGKYSGHVLNYCCLNAIQHKEVSSLHQVLVTEPLDKIKTHPEAVAAQRSSGDAADSRFVQGMWRAQLTEAPRWSRLLSHSRQNKLQPQQ